MAAMPETFHISLVTPERSMLDEDALYADIPAHDGRFGVMHNRAPLLFKLGIGKLRLLLSDNRERLYLLEGGFAQMRNNRLTLLCEQATAADEIVPGEARELFEQALARMPLSDEQLAEKEHDLLIARTMLAIKED